MRRCPTYLVLFATSLALSCSSNSGTVTKGPKIDSACTDLGSSSCSNHKGSNVVAMCALDANSGKTLWVVGETCDGTCDMGQCVEEAQDWNSQDGTAQTDVPRQPDGKEQDVSTEELSPDLPLPDEFEQTCQPDCGGRVCGDDGCGGSCGECVGGEECSKDGSSCCLPACMGKLCGDNGCGGSCGSCPSDMECGQYFQCVPKCEPKCEGRECGPNGCGGSCGTCSVGKACGPGGLCSVCLPQCGTKKCGDDGCGGSCGACTYGFECAAGVCVKACLPICANKNCGDDGCGGSCGECYDGEQCYNGFCLMACEPKCQGKSCGPDGCGGNCGKCAPWEFCSSWGQCVTECTPQCVGKVCGDDGCGGVCGVCSGNSACNSTGQCLQIGGPCVNLTAGGWCDGNTLVACVNNVVVAADCMSMGKNVVCEWMPSLNYFGCNPHGDCQPNCLGKECGGDGCGGSCGNCEFGQACEQGQCTGAGQCGDVSYVGCCSGTTVLWCDNSSLWFMDCASNTDPTKKICGWNGAKGFYDCINAPVEGPLQFPYHCGGTCVPNCINRQCGDDGCGGSCGSCPMSLSCDNNQCVGADGKCGPYSSEPSCDGDNMVWCENNHIQFTNCALQGPNYSCGWVPDLYVYSCYEKPCTPQCSQKKCGPDGCGGVCGYCPSAQFCNDVGQCVNGIGPCGSIDYVGVCDGNVVKWCQNSVLQVFDCDNLGPTFHCGFFDDSYYWCIN